MSATVLERLETEALGLDMSERAQLANRLIERLHEGVEGDPTDVKRAWETEIKKRIVSYRSGEDSGAPADEVFADVRAHCCVSAFRQTTR